MIINFDGKWATDNLTYIARPFTKDYIENSMEKVQCLFTFKPSSCYVTVAVGIIFCVGAFELKGKWSK